MTALVFLKGWRNTIDLGVAFGLIIFFGWLTFHTLRLAVSYVHLAYLSLRRRYLERKIKCLVNEIKSGITRSSRK